MSQNILGTTFTTAAHCDGLLKSSVLCNRVVQKFSPLYIYIAESTQRVVHM